MNSPKPLAGVGRNRRIDLSQVTFNAKIDFVSIFAPCRIELPQFDGKLIWPRRKNGESFTIHDASPRDAALLAEAVGVLPISELEVAVDIRPRPSLRGPAGTEILKEIMVDLIASGFEPDAASGVLKQFRAYVRKAGDYPVVVHPFNTCLPLPTDQQLHGGRQDDVQCKAYLKQTDGRRTLPESEWVARLEVSLRGTGLTSKGLVLSKDLIGFRFRKMLMPLLRHVQGVRLPKSETAAKHLQVIRTYKQREYDCEFAKKGCGPFVVGSHPSEPPKVLLVRDGAMNNRIGLALTHLENRMWAERNRAIPKDVVAGEPMPARVSAGFTGDCIANYI